MKTPLKNTFFIYSSLGFNFLFNLAQLKILTSSLSQNDIGVYFAAAGISLIIGGIYMLGFPMVFSRYIPRFEAESRHDKVEALLWLNTLTFLIPAGVTLLVIGTVAARFSDSPIVDVLPAAFLSHILLFLVSTASAHFAGLRRMHFTAAFNTLPLAFHVVLLYTFRGTLTVRFAFQLLSLAAVPVLAAAVLLIRPRPRLNRRLWREIDHFWGFAILTSLLAPFVLYVDRVVIASVLPLEGLALYMIARKVENAINRVLTIPLYVMAPELSFHEDATGGSDLVMALFRRFRKVYLILGVTLCVLVAAFGRDVIVLLSNRAYTAAYPLLLILLGSAVVGCVYAPYTLLARSLGRMDLYFYSDLTWIIAYALSCPALIWKMGLQGVAWAAVTASTTTMVFVLIRVRPRLRRGTGGPANRSPSGFLGHEQP